MNRFARPSQMKKNIGAKICWKRFERNESALMSERSAHLQRNYPDRGRRARLETMRRGLRESRTMADRAGVIAEDYPLGRLPRWEADAFECHFIACSGVCNPEGGYAGRRRY